MAGPWFYVTSFGPHTTAAYMHEAAESVGKQGAIAQPMAGVLLVHPQTALPPVTSTSSYARRTG